MRPSDRTGDYRYACRPLNLPLTSSEQAELDQLTTELAEINSVIQHIERVMSDGTAFERAMLKVKLLWSRVTGLPIKIALAAK